MLAAATATILESAMWRREPVLIALAGADLVVVAVLTALMSVGAVSIDGTQLAAISAAVVAVTSLVAAVIRAQVVPVDTAASREIDALFTPVPGVQSRNDNLEGL
jgi:hypothetical protein